MQCLYYIPFYFLLSSYYFLIRQDFPLYFPIKRIKISTLQPQNQSKMAFDLEMIKSVYDGLAGKIDTARKVVGRPLTLTEKILYSHLTEGEAKNVYERGRSYV